MRADRVQDERLARNVTEFRLAQKASKRDLESSRRNLLALDADHTLNTGGPRTKAEELIERHDHLRVDNTDLTPEKAAEQVVEAFELRKVLQH
ncbi:hypothetical protein [Kribbella sp. NPDC048928]|uniref:hypothetical protein n=1 Tax=Kribbella sp. NPDC048928 TaxID=3364111 RepID=UPI00371D15EE